MKEARDVVGWDSETTSASPALVVSNDLQQAAYVGSALTLFRPRPAFSALFSRLRRRSSFSSYPCNPISSNASSRLVAMSLYASVSRTGWVNRIYVLDTLPMASMTPESWRAREAASDTLIPALLSWLAADRNRGFSLIKLVI